METVNDLEGLLAALGSEEASARVISQLAGHVPIPPMLAERAIAHACDHWTAQETYTLAKDLKNSAKVEKVVEDLIQAHVGRSEYSHAGQVARDAKMYERAIALFERGEDWISAAGTASYAGLHDRASALFEKGKLWEYAADAASKAGQQERAHELYLRAIEERTSILSSTRIVPAQFSGGTGFSLADYRTIEREFDAAATLALRIGLPLTAIDIYRRLGEADDTKCGAFTQAAKTAAAHGHESLARQLYAREAEGYERVRMDPKAADLYLKAGRPQKAAELWRNFGDFTEAATAYQQAGMISEAIDALVRGKELDTAADLASQHGMQARATELHRQASVQYETEGDYLRAAGCAKNAGLPERAQQLFERAIAKEEEEQNYLDAARIATIADLPERTVANYIRAGILSSAADAAARTGMGDRAAKLKTLAALVEKYQRMPVGESA